MRNIKRKINKYKNTNSLLTVDPTAEGFVSCSNGLNGAIKKLRKYLLKNVSNYLLKYIIQYTFEMILKKRKGKNF